MLAWPTPDTFPCTSPLHFLLPLSLSLPSLLLPIRAAVLNKDEVASVKGLGLLTLKPMIYAGNVNEEDLPNKGADNPHVKVRP